MKALLTVAIILFAMKVYGQETKPANVAAESQCGGFAGIKCEPGFSCKLSADHPDAMGVCVKEVKYRSCGAKTDAMCPKGTKCKGEKGRKTCR